MNGPFYLGIDVGSISANLVLIGSDDGVAFEDYRRVDGRPLRAAQAALAALQAAFPQAAIAGVGTTGSARHLVAAALGADVVQNEISAHACAAIHAHPEAQTVFEIGGQDSKVIRVRKGRMDDFLLNDKCAASTGRYLENMAAVLGISLGELSRHYENPVELSATCAIFGESELIGRIVEGVPASELAAGVNYSIFRRIKPMLLSLASNTVVFTGGVALGPAVAHWVREELGVQVIVPDHPQLNGAIGCAVYTQQRRERRTTVSCNI